MKNHRFLWLRNRTTDNRKCEKARNIKEKRTIEMFSTASRPPVAHLSSASADRVRFYNSNTQKSPENFVFRGFLTTFFFDSLFFLQILAKQAMFRSF